MVKIGEKYKPPPKISTGTTYSQRIVMNKKLHDSLLSDNASYDVTLENNVKAYLDQLRNAKATLAENKKKTLERIYEDRKSRECNVNESTTVIETPLPMLQPIINNQGMNTLVNNVPVKENSINFSDFEVENSTPFDNLELKSINDLEELKLVLEKHEKSTSLNGQTNNHFAIYNGNISTSISNSVQNVNVNHVMPSKADKTNVESNNKIFEILNSLNRDLHINQSTQVEQKVSEKDVLAEFNFPKDTEALCKSVAMMGFPIERVAKACRDLGPDQKTVIDFLLTLTELLDLGFPEDKVYNALISNDNDKDKALEALL